MPKTYRELEKILKKAGYKVVSHSSTSHVKWESPTGQRFTVKNHGKGRTEFSDSYLKKIYKQAGLKH
ncbi:type II toxin-antitoxin system HicA family toxin [Rummeliibacillus stabekisii]|uniref:type II toxin-antitoxin system HicA family toxin n=1 Tax=Rummeliibacillus stabekisii TaxID=241244 RepID=UPI003724457E